MRPEHWRAESTDFAALKSCRSDPARGACSGKELNHPAKVLSYGHQVLFDIELEQSLVENMVVVVVAVAEVVAVGEALEVPWEVRS